MDPGFVLNVLWLLWLLSWLAASFWAERPATRPPLRDELVYRTLTVVGAALIFWQVERVDVLGQLWVTIPVLGWLSVIPAVAGFGFAWRARLHLGTLWSSSVTRKDDHKIIDSGPYGMVRHPIYTGLLLALYATALDHGTLFALVGVLVLTIAFFVKARLEERFLSAELGPGYGQYERRVPMLVPLWPVRSA
jgi:protein-S-isoprenylcysteine O-methyltransferase Ste14